MHIENRVSDCTRDAKAPTDNTSCGTDVQANTFTVTLAPTDLTGAGNTHHKLAIVPARVKVIKGSHSVSTQALLDPGSSTTFLREQLMEQMFLQGTKTEILLQTVMYEKPVKTYKLSVLLSKQP